MLHLEMKHWEWNAWNGPGDEALVIMQFKVHQCVYSKCINCCTKAKHLSVLSNHAVFVNILLTWALSYSNIVFVYHSESISLK